MGPVHWYTVLFFIPLCVLTWALGVFLCFWASSIIGVFALFVALLLTEALLGAYRSEKSAIGNRES